MTNLRYRVDYCLINRPDTCVNGTKISTRKYVIGGLVRNTIYSYHIHVYTTDAAEGPVAADTFITKRKGKNIFKFYIVFLCLFNFRFRTFLTLPCKGNLEGLVKSKFLLLPSNDIHTIR